MKFSHPFKKGIILEAESARNKIAAAFQATELYLDSLSAKTRLEQPEKFKEATTRVFEFLDKANAALATELAIGISNVERLERVGIVKKFSDSLRKSVNHHINIGDHIYQMHQVEQAQRAQQEAGIAAEERARALQAEYDEQMEILRVNAAEMKKRDDAFYDALERKNPAFKGIKRIYVSEELDRRLEQDPEFRKKVLSGEIDGEAFIRMKNEKLITKLALEES